QLVTRKSVVCRRSATAQSSHGTFSSFFFSSRRRHTRFSRDWSSDVCSSDLGDPFNIYALAIEYLNDAPLTSRSLFEKLLTDHKRSEERRVGKECRSRWSREH